MTRKRSWNGALLTEEEETVDPLAVVLTSPPEIGMEIADLSIFIDIYWYYTAK